MIDIPNIGAAELSAAFDQQIEELLKPKMPSLRLLQGAKSEVVRVDFDLRRKEQLLLKAPNSNVVHPAHKDIAQSWLEMVQKIAAPAELTRLKAKVIPSRKKVADLSAAYLAMTIVMASRWPAAVPWPKDISAMQLKLSVALKRSRPRCEVHPGVELIAQSTKKTPTADNPAFDLAVSTFQYYWGCCCDKIVPWLDDGCISEFELLVPVNHPDVPPMELRVPMSSAVH